MGRTHIFLLMACSIASAHAQTTLPDVNVTAPRWEEHHGGYVISSNFVVDNHMSAVVFPQEPLVEGDILSVRSTQMREDEYFVLQECISQDCTEGHVVRVWNFLGPLGGTAHQLERLRIPHEGKFFMWMQRFPVRGTSTGAFTGFEPISPPLVLNPTGTAEQFRAVDLKAAQEAGPEKVVSSDHDGSSYVIRYESGTTMRVSRIRAAD